MVPSRLVAGPAAKHLSLWSLATSLWSIHCSGVLRDVLGYTLHQEADHRATLPILFRMAILVVGANDSATRLAFQIPTGIRSATSKWFYLLHDSNHPFAPLVMVTGRLTVRVAKAEVSRLFMKQLFIAPRNPLDYSMDWYLMETFYEFFWLLLTLPKCACWTAYPLISLLSYIFLYPHPARLLCSLIQRKYIHIYPNHILNSITIQT